MIRIKRSKRGPACLTGPTSPAAVERAAAAAYYGSAPTAAYPFRVYGRPEVKLALEAMSHEKCAYCEMNHGVGADAAVEHYRPKGAFPHEPHPGYWWLASTWTNLLPTCQHCNESRKHLIVEPTMTMAEAARLHRAAMNLTSAGKASHFPVRAARKQPSNFALASEDPLIIDPTRTDPTNHICFPPETGVSVATPMPTPAGPDPYGLATINITALNRFDTVRARSLVLRDLRPHVLSLAQSLDNEDTAQKAQNQMAMDMARAGAAAAIQAITDRANPRLPFSAVAVWLLRRLNDWLQNERAQGVKFEIPAIEGL